MQALYKKDVRQFISIFVDNLDIADYDEVRKKIEKYFKENKIECIITSTNKIIYAYGNKVKDYLNYDVSSKLHEMIDNVHLSSSRSSNLEIVDNVHVKKIYYFDRLKDFSSEFCLILFYKFDQQENAYNFLIKNR